MITHSCSPPFRAFGTRWFLPSDHFEIHGDGPESELTSRRDVFLFFCHFPMRCSGSGVVLIVSIPSLLFILTRVPTRKKYRLLCYPLRSNSGWLPIRCAYFILLCNSIMKKYEKGPSHRTHENLRYIEYDINLARKTPIWCL